MKAFFKEFFKRGFISAWGGPFVLAIIYYIVGRIENIKNIPINEVSLGIISITLMAFIAGGITAIYQNDVLPLASSILIHAAVLYLDYLIMYLLNSWIPRSEIGIFTAIFIAGFALIWFIIYLCTKNKAEGINKMRQN
ncbi:MAG: DUF3021 domain-containing protein [Oscillospiraceae bacterium]|nr:DUF3021 domain-containing protein [Oscillospiraceae bacterium]MBR3952078.1 DUF3021 domain-containing protein [Oscillospiraceae bacterium]